MEAEVTDIRWSGTGSSLDFVRTANEGRPFNLLLDGPIAKAFTKTFGVEAAALTPETVGLVIALAIIAAVSALVLYALSRGYTVSGRARTAAGEEYELQFRTRS